MTTPDEDTENTLDTEVARPLTKRECAKLLGGTIGCLVDMAPVEVVHEAVKWWAETGAAWEFFADSEVDLNDISNGVDEDTPAA